MSTFKAGEVAIMRNAKVLFHLNGKECTVLDGPCHWRLVNCGGAIIFGYQIKTQDGETYTCEPHQLRKKRPPESDDSAARQAMLDCIERAKMPVEVSA